MQITSTKQFIDLFNFTEESGFYDPTPLQDEDIGFSIKKKYPKEIRFKPAVKRDGEPDEIIVIWLVYNLPKPETAQENKIPILINIKKYSLYRTKYFDYILDDPESPTRESILKSKKSPQPLELEFINDFFYNLSAKCFIDKKGNHLSGIEMLDMVVNQHLKTVHIVKGIKIRSKIFTQLQIGGILRLIIKSFVFLLKYPFGRVLKDSDNEIFLYNGFDLNDMKRITTDTIEIFKYHASKHVITTFCIVIISISSIDYFFKIDSDYLKYISNNNLLSITYSVALLLFLDLLLPKIIFYIINVLIKVRNKIVFRKLKV